MTPASTAGPYSPIVQVGEWLVVSGQLGVTGGRLVEGGTEAELAQAVTNLSALLDAHGAGLDDVVKTTVFLADIGDFAAMNEVYAAAFGDHRPARSAVAVAALPLGARVQIEAWARAPGR